MRDRLILSLCVLFVSAVGGVAIAGAQGGDSGDQGSTEVVTDSSDQAGGVPEGPEVDFCPTEEQTEEHAKMYGFDYKPTVSCDEDEVSEPGGGSSPEDSMTQSEVLAEDKAALQSAKPLPDSDGDPTTIEGELPNGDRIIIGVSTDDPSAVKGMTPAEFAEKVYP